MNASMIGTIHIHSVERAINTHSIVIKNYDRQGCPRIVLRRNMVRMLSWQFQLTGEGGDIFRKQPARFHERRYNQSTHDRTTSHACCNYGGICRAQTPTEATSHPAETATPAVAPTIAPKVAPAALSAVRCIATV